MKLLQFLTLTSNLHSNITNVSESIQQVYQTMQVVAEIEKFDKFFNDAREAWVGGIADFGDPQAAIQMQQHPQYDVYRESLGRAVAEHLGDPFVAYRLMSKDQIEEWQSGADMPAIAVSTELSIAKAFRKLAANRGRDDLQVVQLSVPADAVIMLGHSREHELVVDANYISAHEIGFLNESVMLTELQEIGDPSNMTAGQLRDELAANGWDEVGTDSRYSRVYGKESSPWVIKILRYGIFNLGKSDTNTNFMCAMQWYRYCLNNWENNPHVPRIPFVKTLLENDNDRQTRTYVVMIEELEPFNPRTYQWRRDDLVDNLMMFGMMRWVNELDSWHNETDIPVIIATALCMLPRNQQMEFLEMLIHTGEFHSEYEESSIGDEEWCHHMAADMIASGHDRWKYLLVDWAMEVAEDMKHPLAMLMAHIHGTLSGGCKLDIHEGNIMVRPSTNELVITDPVQG